MSIIKSSIVRDDIMAEVCSSLGLEFILEDGGTDCGRGINYPASKIPMTGSYVLLIFLQLLFTARDLNLKLGRKTVPHLCNHHDVLEFDEVASIFESGIIGWRRDKILEIFGSI